MNSLKTILIVISFSLIGTPAFANQLNSFGNYISRTDAKTLQVAPTKTKQHAYEAALSKLNALEDTSSIDLNKELKVWSINVQPHKTHLKEGGYVTVQERMNNNGEIEYVGLVNVKVHYIERNSNN